MILCFVTVSVISIIIKIIFLSTTPNFLSEGVRLGPDKEIAPDGTYYTYFPSGAMIERSRIPSYHKKLLYAENSLNLWSNIS